MTSKTYYRPKNRAKWHVMDREYLRYGWRKSVCGVETQNAYVEVCQFTPSESNICRRCEPEPKQP